MDSKPIDDVKPNWKPSEIISCKLQLKYHNVANVVNLLEEGATVPFIARYRKDQTGDMSPDTIREVVSQLEDLSNVASKISNVYKSIIKLGKMTPDLQTYLTRSTTLHEVEALYAPFKPGHKGSYAERAKALGLDPVARDVLRGRNVNLSLSVQVGKEGLETIKDVEKGVKHIIADIIAKDSGLTNARKDFCNSTTIYLQSTRSNAKPSKKKDHPETKASLKFEQYFDFKMSTKLVKPHQILAINRGEDLQVLTVKIIYPASIEYNFLQSCKQKFLVNGRHSPHMQLHQLAATDSFHRLIQPAMSRSIRSELTKKAEFASVSVFSSNLHSLLLQPPVKNATILGLDPGFTHGCKFAVISALGCVLTTGVAHLHDHKADRPRETNRLLNVIHEYRCEIIAIGNGVACRETEQVISGLIKSNKCLPLKVVYCIVDECGASIYSVSPEAQAELPKLDPTHRGAVTIGRRLQDPLAELVKISPGHLGVGMYQHDLNKKQLDTALSSVVEECVSFVGVDINTCSQCLLARVAGLNNARAKNILEWRTKHGPFTSRAQLMDIKGLGKKSFEQCAGFIRVTRGNAIVKQEEYGTTSLSFKTEVAKPGQKRKKEEGSSTNATAKKKAKKSSSAEWNPLDCTAVHPESYNLATELMDCLRVDKNDLGTPEFIRQVGRTATDKLLQDFSESHGAGIATVRLIVDAFKQPLTYDIRDKSQKPIFKQEVMSVDDLKRGSHVTGRVTNVTHFGAFVDIGVGINGLIHISKFGRWGKLALGDCVEVIVENVEAGRGRIGLALVNVKKDR